jgi:hypothetical protein
VKVRALRLWNVRRFAKQGVAIENIGDGVNVLAAENEQGKSTCFDGLHALLFQAYSGTPKQVQMLRPYSGGSPRIEADIETDAGVFRITKQFYAGREATVMDLATHRLVAQADQAEAWISDLTRGGASGPTGLLWVRQGLTDFESGGKAQRDQEFKAREDALSSVAGEVEALTGGRRMAWILERCEAELAELVTANGNARKGGPYALAKDEHEQLVEEERTQADLVRALRAALDERKRKVSRRVELMDPSAAQSRQHESDLAAAALKTAKSHADQLLAAISRHEIETERHGVAQERLAHYRGALDRAAELAAALSEGEVDYSKALSAQSLAQKTEEDTVRLLGEAEAGHTTARDTLRLAETAERINDAKKQMEELGDRLRKADQSHELIQQLVARAAALSIPTGVIARLEVLDAEISKLNARLEASSPLVTIDYADNPSSSILVEGTALDHGEAHHVSRSTRFDIPTVGALTVSAGVSAEDATSKTVREKQNELDRGLEGLGVETLAELRERDRDFREVTSELQVAKAEFAAWAPNGIETLRTEITQLEALVETDQVDAPEPEVAARDAKEAENRVTLARNAAETARAQLSTRREIALEAKLGLDHLLEKVEETARALGPVDEREAKLNHLRATEESVATQRKSAFDHVEHLKSNAPDLDAADAAARRAASVVTNIDTEVKHLDQEISELTGSITARSDDAVEEILGETQERLTVTANRVAALEMEIAVLNRLKQALTEARAAAQEQYFGPVMAELRPLLSLLMDDGTITFDDGTLLPRTLERNGQDEDISALSGGMREQLTVLTRLAFARLLAKNGRPVPVILDDALVYSDDDRIERMFDALHHQARDLQIIVFSCRQRAFEKLGGQSLRMTDWTPDQPS